MGFGSPALRHLLRLKLRGTWRRQWRRTKTVKGLVLSLLGVVLVALWFSGLALHFGNGVQRLTEAAGDQRVRVFGLMLLLVTLTSAMTHRGLFLPRDEIERLFSAPVSRPDLVRYRLLAGGLRSALGGVVLGLIAIRRMPLPVAGFLGTLLAMQTLTALNQMAAILLGGLERGTARRLGRTGGVLLGIAVAGAVVLGVVLPTVEGGLAGLPLVGPTLAEFLEHGGDALSHPLVARLTLPLAPWGRMIAAGETSDFLIWFGVCSLLHVLAIEACARLPVDFRELSLATSARVTARMARVRRGGGAAAMRASTRLARWRLPHLWGRSPVGAVAWRKGLGLARKAKGTLLVSLLALGFLSLLPRLIFRDDPEQLALGTPILIGVLGTFYLCSGLRFDFREDLERMDVVRAWPLAPWRCFLGTLLPEVCAVALLLDAAVLLNALASGAMEPTVWAVLLCLPCVVFAWVALDNAVFLFAPVRFVPGQEGLLQNAGRGIVLMLLRAVLLALTGIVAGAPAWGAFWLGQRLEWTPESAIGTAIGVFLVGLMGVDVALVALGGFVLRRFDVARDRG